MIFMKKKTSFKQISFYSSLLIVVFFACALHAEGQVPQKTAQAHDTTRTWPPCPGYCPACQSINAKVKASYNLETMSFQQPKNVHDWITLDITFKKNTDAEFREKAVRAIEKMWIKEAAPL